MDCGVGIVRPKRTTYGDKDVALLSAAFIDIYTGKHASSHSISKYGSFIAVVIAFFTTYIILSAMPFA